MPIVAGFRPFCDAVATSWRTSAYALRRRCVGVRCVRW